MRATSNAAEYIYVYIYIYISPQNINNKMYEINFSNSKRVAKICVQ